MNIEATHLGHKSTYPKRYDSSVLVAVPRILNREQYEISNDALPFSGMDVWHAYEFSFILINGLPVCGILKIVYPCTNEFLVESKSLKLYLNSFNMERFGTTVDAGILEASNSIKTDLEKLLNCKVEVHFFKHKQTIEPSDFNDFKILEDFIANDVLKCELYYETPSLLEPIGCPVELKWGTHLLRSNCKITFQPDWGSLFISMRGENGPTPESFLKYIISLRNENHFHEEICEMVFKRMIDFFHPDQLMVTCQYTRRGGIDINPVRSLTGNDYPYILVTPNKRTEPAFRQ